MMSNRRALPLSIAIALLSTAAQAQITVGANVHVSRMRDSLVHDEVLMGTDPRDPMKLIGCSIAHIPGRRSLMTILYHTRDGGASWQPAVTDSNEMSGDPVCLYGSQGRAYFIAISYSGKTSSTMSVFRSTDG